MTSKTDLTRQVKDAARDAGFDAVGLTSPSLNPRIERALTDWIARGYGADMTYMIRDGATRARPLDRWPDTRSILCLGVNYYAPRPPAPPGARAGRVSVYAYGRDYHKVIAKRLKRLTRDLGTLLGEDAVLRSYTDTGPILERAFAAQAGLGFVGKNTNVISQLFGSWIFLSTILLRSELDHDQPITSVSCGTCTRCLDACPTRAFPAPYVLDATRCIAYHTVESRDPVPPDLLPHFGDWVVGCDICQDVCPFNESFARPTGVEAFAPSQGAGAWLDLDALAALDSQEAFLERFQGTPLTRPGLLGLKRFL